MTDQRSHLAFVCSAGSGGDGIVTLRLDADGSATEIARSPVDEPSFLAVGPDGEHAYAVRRVDGGRVTAYDVDAETGELSRLNDRSSEGAAPCYVGVDAEGRCAFVANYQGGTVAAYPIEDDGRLGEAGDVVRHEGSGADPDRQAAPHPHSIDPGPDGRFVYAPDLGTDRIEVYRPEYATGRLRPAEAGPARSRAGAGPRHFAFRPDGTYVYVVNELDSTVSAFERDPETGALAEVDRTSTLPPEFDGDNAPADVHVHPTGRWAYVSNRGHDSVAVFAVDAGTGRLEPIDHEPTLGETPRDIALAPDGEHLVAADQHGDSVVVFAVDADSGRLDPVADLAVPKPVCAKFLAAE